MYVILFLLLFTLTASAQPAIEWTQTFGGDQMDYGWSVVETNDGGYAIAGYTGAYIGDDAILIKTDSHGDKVWRQTYGGGDYEEVYCLQQTDDNGFIMAGRTLSFGQNFDQFYVVKTDADGVVEWERSYGGGAWDWANYIIQTPDGGYAVIGVTDSFGPWQGVPNIWLLRLDSGGEVIWDRTYGGAGWDEAYCIEMTGDGGFIIAGSTDSYGQGHDDVYLIKTDSCGEAEWERTFAEYDYDQGYKVRQTVDGGYVIAGQTQILGSGNGEVYLIKTDPGGNEIWSRTYGGDDFEEGFSLDITEDGGYLIGGVTLSSGSGRQDMLALKTDSAGNVQWSGAYGYDLDDRCRSAIQTSDGGFILTGITGQFYGTGGDVWLVKLASLSSGAVSQQIDTPQSFELLQPAPNPFNPLTRIGFRLDKQDNIDLSVYNTAGRRISALAAGDYQPGIYFVDFDGQGLSSGTYFITLRSTSATQTKKVVLLK